MIPIGDDLEKISNNLGSIAEIEIDERANRFLSVNRDRTEKHVTRNILAYSIFERKLLTLIENDLSNFVLVAENSFPNTDSK